LSRALGADHCLRAALIFLGEAEMRQRDGIVVATAGDVALLGGAAEIIGMVVPIGHGCLPTRTLARRPSRDRAAANHPKWVRAERRGRDHVSSRGSPSSGRGASQVTRSHSLRMALSSIAVITTAIACTAQPHPAQKAKATAPSNA